MKVLIVDDHAVFRRMVRSMLPQHLVPVEAENGEAAQAVYTANPDIRLILTDFNMPKINGLDMIVRLRAAGLPAATPIVFLSSERDPALLERATALGIREWLPKPFKKEQLTAVLAKLAL